MIGLIYNTHLFNKHLCLLCASLMVKNLPAMQETQVRFLGQEDPLEKETKLAWETSWTEEPGRLQSMG